MSAAPVLLLAEDEALIADLIALTLQDAGFEVVTVDSGVAAIAELEAQPERFAGLITDIRMSGGRDGWDVSRRARELIPGLPVVYMSGDSEEKWTSHGVPHSVMVPKPFAPAQVVTAIAGLLNAR
jgi:CheY-like chemotaxis protein